MLGWLPDLDRWAKLIHQFLKPKGQLVLVEFHPVVWMYDEDFNRIKYKYFKNGPIHETEIGTYADIDAAISQEYVTWNHSLSEIITNLITQRLEIVAFQEFDYSTYNCFNRTKEISSKKYIIEHLGQNIAMVYAIKSIKK